MASKKHKQHAKQIFQSTLDKFKDIAGNMPDKDSRFDLICKRWQAIIDDEELVEKLSFITNFEALVGYQRQFTKNLSYDRIIAREAEKSAEIDLAIHLIREKRGVPITRLSETTDYKSPDFKQTNGSELYESKYLETLSKSAIKSKANEALTQIKEYAQANKLLEFGGTVHIFTFDSSMYGTSLQSYLETIKQEMTHTFSFPFNLNLQTYSSGIYGDACFR